MTYSKIKLNFLFIVGIRVWLYGEVMIFELGFTIYKVLQQVWLCKFSFLFVRMFISHTPSPKCGLRNNFYLCSTVLYAVQTTLGVVLFGKCDEVQGSGYCDWLLLQKSCSDWTKFTGIGWIDVEIMELQFSEGTWRGTVLNGANYAPLLYKSKDFWVADYVWFILNVWWWQNVVMDKFDVNHFFLLRTVCPVDRTPRCTFSTQKVLRRHLGLELKGRDPVSWWGTWRTWWSRQRPRCRITVQTRTKTWLLKTLESGKPLSSTIYNRYSWLSFSAQACLSWQTWLVSANLKCSQQGRGAWGNFQKGSVQEDLGGTL